MKSECEEVVCCIEGKPLVWKQTKKITTLFKLIEVKMVIRIRDMIFKVEACAWMESSWMAISPWIKNEHSNAFPLLCEQVATEQFIAKHARKDSTINRTWMFTFELIPVSGHSDVIIRTVRSRSPTRTPLSVINEPTGKMRFYMEGFFKTNGRILFDDDPLTALAANWRWTFSN